MGVNIQPIENLALAQGAGEAVGNLEKKLFEIKRNDQIAAELRQMDMQKQRDMFNEQLQMEAEQRAKQWELDKMTIRSQNDFAKEEAARTLRLKKAQTQYDQIEEIEQSGKYSGSNVVARMWQDWGKMYYEDDPRAAEKLGVAEEALRPGMKQLTPPQQLSNINAAMELESYTPEDLVQYGLNPQQFPNVGGMQNKANVDNAIPTAIELRKQNTKEAYELGKQLGYWN